MPPEPNKGVARALPRIRDNEWIVGRLLEHGAAKYQFGEANALSYYLRLRTDETAEAARRRIEDEERTRPGLDGSGTQPRPPTHADGGVRTLWGADLKRAIEHSKSHVKVGQVVAARLIGREPLPITRRPTNPEIPRYRNRWEVETPQFIVERTKTARQILDNPTEARREGKSHPELAGTYLALRGAEIIAKHRYPHPDDQNAFVARVRAALALSTERDSPKTAEPPVRE